MPSEGLHLQEEFINFLEKWTLLIDRVIICQATFSSFIQ